MGQCDSKVAAVDCPGGAKCMPKTYSKDDHRCHDSPEWTHAYRDECANEAGYDGMHGGAREQAIKADCKSRNMTWTGNYNNCGNHHFQGECRSARGSGGATGGSGGGYEDEYGGAGGSGGAYGGGSTGLGLPGMDGGAAAPAADNTMLYLVGGGMMMMMMMMMMSNNNSSSSRDDDDDDRRR